MKVQVICSCLLCAIAFLPHCSRDDSTSSATGPDPVVTGCEQIPFGPNYIMQNAGDDLFEVTRPAFDDSTRTCFGNSLSLTVESYEDSSDTAEILLEGDSLLWNIDFDLWPDEIAFVDDIARMFFPKSSELDLYYVFVRKGSGVKLVGSWKPVAFTYKDLDGVLNLGNKAVADSVAKLASQNMGDPGIYVEISGSYLSFYAEAAAADEFMAEWAQDSAAYDIGIEKLSQCQVRLTGNKTEEIVTVVANARAEVVVESDNSDHESHVYYTQNPRSCPNPQEPDWWSEFLDGNRR
ncbi:MAG: hypothetical protein GF398_07110 [Chitinivibrionales bacterium]|nr:hypothetical protein [Chitinivibrionales bacterium]